MASLPYQESEISSALPAVETRRVLSRAWLNWRDCTDALTDEWSALAERTADPNPFAEQWFVLPSLETLDGNQSVRLLIFREGNQLRAIAPVSRSHSYFGYPIPHWRLWKHDNAFCGSPLIESGYETEFWNTFLDWIDTESRLGLFVHLGQMPEQSAAFVALRNVLNHTARPAAIVQREERAQLRSDLDSESYFTASMSGKKRKELRRQFARLSELGTISTERLTGTETLHKWTEEFLTLEAAGWKGREGSALASAHATAAMFRSTLASGAQAGNVERLALRLDGRAIAMLVNFVTPPGVYSFKTAFDEDYSRFSPGVLLQRENLALLDNPEIEWADSCAAADHPMIERIWREKRSMVSINIGIGGAIRHAIFNQMLRREKSAETLGAAE